MKFVEVSPGQTINLESIESFEESLENRTFIRTKSGKEMVINLSYEFLKNLISQSSSIEKSVAQLAFQNRYQTP